MAAQTFTEPTHGKYSTYTNYGCRCDACRQANADHHRDYNHRTGRSVRYYKRRAKAA